MIDILPPIYPNELFYGWISRYHQLVEIVTEVQFIIYLAGQVILKCS